MRVNIINTEAVTVPSLMMMTSIVSEESLARDKHAYPHRHSLVCVNFFFFFKKHPKKPEQQQDGNIKTLTQWELL